MFGIAKDGNLKLIAIRIKYSLSLTCLMLTNKKRAGNRFNNNIHFFQLIVSHVDYFEIGSHSFRHPLITSAKISFLIEY